jgi:hypothetical protein
MPTSPAVGYDLVGNRVYFHAGYNNGHAIELVGVDVKSFEIWGGRSSESNYAMDRSHVYFKGRIIKGADPETFVKLHSFFSKDARFVYYNDTRLSHDPDHFEFLDDSVQKDSIHVYRGGWIISNDPVHFRFIGALDGVSYYQDKNGILANSTRLPGADVASFKPMRFGYSRDAQRVYKMEGMVARVVEGASPAGFQVYNAYYAHDQEQVFWCGRPISGIDPDSFAILREKGEPTLGNLFFAPELNTRFLPEGEGFQKLADKQISFGLN